MFKNDVSTVHRVKGDIQNLFSYLFLGTYIKYEKERNFNNTAFTLNYTKTFQIHNKPVFFHKFVSVKRHDGIRLQYPKINNGVFIKCVKSGPTVYCNNETEEKKLQLKRAKSRRNEIYKKLRERFKRIINKILQNNTAGQLEIGVRCNNKTLTKDKRIKSKLTKHYILNKFDSLLPTPSIVNQGKLINQIIPTIPTKTIPTIPRRYRNTVNHSIVTRSIYKEETKKQEEKTFQEIREKTDSLEPLITTIIDSNTDGVKNRTRHKLLSTRPPLSSTQSKVSTMKVPWKNHLTTSEGFILLGGGDDDEGGDDSDFDIYGGTSDASSGSGENEIKKTDNTLATFQETTVATETVKHENYKPDFFEKGLIVLVEHPTTINKLTQSLSTTEALLKATTSTTTTSTTTTTTTTNNPNIVNISKYISIINF